jgi:hypothetical protein
MAAATSLEFNHQNQKLVEKNLSLLQVLFWRRNSSPILVNPLQNTTIQSFIMICGKKKVEILQADLSIIIIIISRLASVAFFRQSNKRCGHPDWC